MASWKLWMSNLRHSWKEFVQLTWQERWLLFQSVVFLALIAAGLHLMNFQRLRSLLLRFSSVSPDVCGDAALEQASTTSRLVQAAASRMHFNITCLARSTTLWWLLRRQGIASEIRIGVNQQEGEFQAHAWVEIDSIVLNDKADIHHHYAAFDRITLPKGTEWV
jgi:hypothetical protein